MAETTTISWCDHTFNHVSGCTKVAEGCKFCYAEVNYSVKMRGVKWGPNGNRVLASPSMWKQPLKWNRQAEKGICPRCHGKGSITDPGSILVNGEPQPKPPRECENCHGKKTIGPYRAKVFCASLADVFEDWGSEIRDSSNAVLHRCHNGHFIPCQSVHAHGTECDGGCNSIAMPLTMDDCRRRLFDLIDATPHLDWLLLTKRPENVLRMWPHRAGPWIKDGRTCVESWYRKNVWLGTSIACRKDLPNLDHLRACADLTPVPFVSFEPLLEDLGRVDFRGIRWVIIGGESGPHARPCDVAWIRSLRDQAHAAGVACFVKQLGSNSGKNVAGTPSGEFIGKDWLPYRLQDPKGGDMSEWQPELCVRETPE